MTTAPTPRSAASRSAPHIATLVLLAGLSALTMNVFLPSLPGMTAYFQTEYRTMQLSVAVYLAMSAVLQILIGPISDKLGRRPVLLWGLALFVLATIGCLLAPNAAVFLVFRMAQAVVAVGMVLSRAIVRDLYPQDKAASMIGYVTMGMAVVPMVGPAVGGLLDEFFGWHANFVLLAVLGLATIALTWVDLGETAAASGKTLAGQFREYPTLLRAPRFWGYSLTSGFSSGAFFAYLGGAPFVGTVVYGLDPAELGVYFGAPAFGYFLGNFLTGRFATRFGVNRMVWWGCLLVFGGLLTSFIVELSGWGSAVTFFGLTSAVGLGNGMAIPNATAGMLSVRPHLAGTASGLGGAIMIGLGAALSALAGSLLTAEAGALQLIAIMLATAGAAVISMRFVLWREKRLGLAA